MVPVLVALIVERLVRTVEGMFVVLQVIVGRTGPLKKRGCPSVYRRGASLLVQGHARFSTVGCRTFSVPFGLQSI